MKTQAIVFTQPRQVEVRAVELPKLENNNVLVKTLLSAVSVGTERWAYMGLRNEIGFPNVPGYMAVGEIVEVGSAVQGLKVGERIYFGASRLAGDVAGKSWMSSHLADAVVDVSVPTENQEFFSWSKIPAGAEPEDVSLASLCAVSMRGIELAGVPAGVKVLVVGLGVIGQYAAQVCRLKGAKVAVTDVSVERLAVASQLGADWAIDSTKEKLAERAGQIAPGGFDIVIETSSKGEVVNTLWPLVRRYGKFVFQGWYPPLTGLDLNAAHGRMPTTFFPCGYSGPAVAASLQWMRDGRLATRPLVTHTFKPAEAGRAYTMLLENKEYFLGLTFDWRK